MTRHFQVRHTRSRSIGIFSDSPIHYWFNYIYVLTWTQSVILVVEARRTNFKLLRIIPGRRERRGHMEHGGIVTRWGREES